MTDDWIFQAIKSNQADKAGRGRGNWGHAGRPGSVGGSAPSGTSGSDSIREEGRARAQRDVERNPKLAERRMGVLRDEADREAIRADQLAAQGKNDEADWIRGDVRNIRAEADEYEAALRGRNKPPKQRPTTRSQGLEKPPEIAYRTIGKTGNTVWRRRQFKTQVDLEDWMDKHGDTVLEVRYAKD